VEDALEQRLQRARLGAGEPAQHLVQHRDLHPPHPGVQRGALLRQLQTRAAPVARLAYTPHHAQLFQLVHQPRHGPRVVRKRAAHRRGGGIRIFGEHDEHEGLRRRQAERRELPFELLVHRLARAPDQGARGTTAAEGANVVYLCPGNHCSGNDTFAACARQPLHGR